jgi:hypothetical protein
MIPAHPKTFGAVGSGAVSGGVVGMRIGELVEMRMTLETGRPFNGLDSRPADKL